MLLNVTYHGDLCRSIAEEEESTDLLVDVLQMFRDIGPVFCLAAETLCRLIESHKDLKDDVRLSFEFDIIFQILSLNFTLFISYVFLDDDELERTPKAT